MIGGEVKLVTEQPMHFEFVGSPMVLSVNSTFTYSKCHAGSPAVDMLGRSVSDPSSFSAC